MSVFAVLRKGSSLHVGVNKRGGRWASEWLPSITKSTGEDLDEEWAAWRLPSAYIFEGEHPDYALVRVIRGQLGVSKFAYSSPRGVLIRRAERMVSREQALGSHVRLRSNHESDPPKTPALEGTPFLGRLRAEKAEFRLEQRLRARDSRFEASLGT
jgi:hypothetical protein